MMRSDTNNSDMLPPRQSVSSPVVVKPAPPPKPLVRLAKEDGKYLPKKRKISFDGGYDVKILSNAGQEIDSLAPDFPLFQELGVVDLNAITLALRSMIPAEVRQALDKLALISSNPGVPIKLQECNALVNALGRVGLDLLDNLKVDKKTNTLSVISPATYTFPSEDTRPLGKTLISKIFEEFKEWEGKNDELVLRVDSVTGEPVKEIPEDIEAMKNLDETIKSHDEKNKIAESSSPLPETDTEENTATSYFGFTPYFELLETSRDEVESLRKSSDFWKEAIVDRFMCITMILRNLSFTDTNQPCLVREPTIIQFLFKLIRALAGNPNLVSSKRRRLNLQKDLITLIANLGLYIHLPSPADAFSLLLLILSFAPEKSPYKVGLDGKEEVMFAEYSPLEHRYLACAVDAFAKLIPRDPPNRGFFEDIFLGTCNDETFLALLERHLQGRKLREFELLTRSFALAVSTIPRTDYKTVPKALQIRKPLLEQSLLVAEHLAQMVPRYGFYEDLVEPCKHVSQAQTEYNLAVKWLQAAEGFGSTLLRATVSLGAITTPEVTPLDKHQQPVNPFARVTRRGANILYRLGQKALEFKTAFEANREQQAADAEGSGASAPLAASEHEQSEAGNVTFGVLPTPETVLTVLLSRSMNEKVVTNLCNFLEEGKV